MLLATLSILLALAYAALLTAYRWGWRALPEGQLPEGFQPRSSISVLIPARNEAANIGACLWSILDGSFPKNLLEVIVIDDFSEDGTWEVARGELQVASGGGQVAGGKLQVASDKWQVARVLRLADHLPPEARFCSNKKKAIELGVACAKGDIIVTTDADCVAPKDWLMLIAAHFDPTPTATCRRMLCAPVAFHREKNLLQKFQSLDFLGLMGITGAGAQLGWHRMANGANLAYRRQVFEAVGGYAGNEHLASGDDMFLVQKVAARWPGSVAFLKSREAAVLTEAAPDWRAFWQQRLRWGTKNAALPSWPMRGSLLTVFLFCWSIWGHLAFALAGIFSWQIFLFQIGTKAAFDFFFLSEMCRFFKRPDLLRWFLPSFLLHTAYIPIVGTASIFFKKYTWKGRLTK
ncbi:MAG: glycosyltransferase [Saprospiraceae bacterium]